MRSKLCLLFISIFLLMGLSAMAATDCVFVTKGTTMKLFGFRPNNLFAPNCVYFDFNYFASIHLFIYSFCVESAPSR